MKSVLEYLENTVRTSAAANTIWDGQEEISYPELLRESQNVGAALLRHCIPNGEGVIKNGIFSDRLRRPVPVLMDKGVAALAAFMGIVYAGCFYVLLNPDLPQERLKIMLTVMSPDMIITDQKNFVKAMNLADRQTVLRIEELRCYEVSDADKEALGQIRGNVIDTDPLYANFTSGSTGVPKGVLVSHRSVIDFIDQFTGLFEITKNDVIANQAPFDFDVSVKDIYSALKTGAKLVIVEKGLFSKPTELLDCLCDKCVTVMTWAVSALCLITTFHALDYRVPMTVKKVLFSGEVMPWKHLQEWLAHLPDALFVNLYGPTEITCNCVYHIVDRNRNYENGIPIGRAFPNERVFLLDGDDHIISPGDEPAEMGVGEAPTGKGSRFVGEICVAGTALALGYYSGPEETGKVFVKNPANAMYDERIYRTGDLAYYDENGDLMFAGRKDFQIKHMGHRIELEEIERYMMALDGIDRCCCIFDDKKSRLTGFYVGECESKKLHELLSAKLPIFMVPGALRPLKEMPVTKNGKIDRKLLSELARNRKAYKEYAGRPGGSTV